MGKVHKNRKVKLTIKPGLERFFQVIEADDNAENGTTKIKCKLEGCEGKTRIYNYHQGWSNHERHLATFHKLKMSEINLPVSRGLEGFGFVHNEAKMSNKDTWRSSDPRQIKFEQNLLDLICISGIPWDVTSQRPFVRLVRGLQNSVRIPNRATMKRKLVKHHDKVQKHLKQKLKNIKAGELHLSLDHWTSRNHASILGIRCHFADDDYKMQNFTVGFLEFPFKKTSSNVRDKFKEFINKEGNISPEQLGVIMTDNASEMRVAFSGNFFNEDIGESNSPLEETEQESDWLDIEEVDLTEDFVDPEDDFVNGDSEYNDVIGSCLDWSSCNLERRGCLAHALHLVVLECIKKNPSAAALVDYMKKLVAFFSMSTYWHSQLVNKTKKKLVKPGLTRWNSVLEAINRLLELNFIESINEVLRDAKCVAPLKYSGPVEIDNVLKEQLQELSNLLTPFLNLSNTLQSDGVTSSLAIPGVIGLYKAVAARECSCEYMIALRASLCLAITERFARSETFVNHGPGKNKALLKIFDSEVYTLATLLDPRLKTAPFKVPLEEKYLLHMYVPNVEKVTPILHKHYNQFKPVEENQDFEVVRRENESCTEKPRTQTSFIFEHVNKVAQIDLTVQVIANEVEQYLREPLIGESECPLLYWKHCRTKYPTLSEMAKKYLAIPASSGSVERLFSVAGALIRARRARLTTETVSMMIQYREYRLEMLKSVE